MMVRSRNSRKLQLADSIKWILDSKLVVVLSVSLNSEEMFAVRKSIWSFGGNINVIKNSIVRLLVNGSEYQFLSGFLNGVTAFARCGDNADIPGFLRALFEFSSLYSESHFAVAGAKLDSGYLNVDLMKKLSIMQDVNHICLNLVEVLYSVSSSLVESLLVPPRLLTNALQCERTD